MSVLTLRLSTNATVPSVQSNSAVETAKNLERLFHSLAAGALMPNGASLVCDITPLAAANTVTCASVQAGDTVEVGGAVLTAVAGAPGADEFSIDGTNSACAASLAAAINAAAASAGVVSAAANSAAVTVTAAVKGKMGNGIRLTSSNGTRLAIGSSATTLRNGSDGTSTSFSF